ncbi:hypothetical protein AAC03nite_01220 [Alicyclobacillus acidoterrestris]|uniref:hypothetical protein n=1 Tax=Alicyclobacillus suci TaxID=2816080 RepID=UPI0011974ECE|nr:hypothetical protein [Alicyclobacillus suci]GEO24337.1 hypothetical protein AAC03nite_01220 [Alicyclobacillus acidoterrestris]
MDQEVEREVRKVAEQAARNFRAEFGDEISGLRNQVVEMQKMIKQLGGNDTAHNEEGQNSDNLLQQLSEFGQTSQEHQQRTNEQLMQCIQQSVQLLGQALKFLQTNQVLTQMNLFIANSQQQLQTQQMQGQQFEKLGEQYMQQGQGNREREREYH